MEFKNDNLGIGDEVYFERAGVDNYSLYWKIVNIVDDRWLEVEVNRLNINDRKEIEIDDVTSVIRAVQH